MQDRQKKKNTLTDALNLAATQPAIKGIKIQNSYDSIKSREGKRMVAGYFSPDVHRNLKMIAVQNDISLQDIVYEAISEYLKAKGYPSILNEDNLK